MKRARGFTLVEVMVAAMLVVLAVAAALGLVAGGRRAQRSAEAQARLAETARMALDTLAHEVRMAGFLGRLPPGTGVAGSSPVGSPPAPELAVAGGCVDGLAHDLSMPLAGADGAHAARTGVALGCGPSPSGRGVAGADTLVVRHASSSPAAPDAGRLQLESTRRTGRLFADGVARLGPPAQVGDLEVSVFYVSADSTGQPGRPALRRKRLVGGTIPSFQDEELVAGIEDLQVEVAPVPGSGATDDVAAFQPLDTLAPGMGIRALRLWVLVRSDVAEPLPQALPPLEYANRTVPATTTRHRRLLASRIVAPRNAAGAP